MRPEITNEPCTCDGAVAKPAYPLTAEDFELCAGIAEDRHEGPAPDRCVCAWSCECGETESERKTEPFGTAEELPSPGLPRANGDPPGMPASGRWA